MHKSFNVSLVPSFTDAKRFGLATRASGPGVRPVLEICPLPCAQYEGRCSMTHHDRVRKSSNQDGSSHGSSVVKLCSAPVSPSANETNATESGARDPWAGDRAPRGKPRRPCPYPCGAAPPRRRRGPAPAPAECSLLHTSAFIRNISILLGSTVFAVVLLLCTQGLTPLRIFSVGLAPLLAQGRCSQAA
jgi:hypothetical protein